jgi:hypothetical protein
MLHAQWQAAPACERAPFEEEHRRMKAECVCERGAC